MRAARRARMWKVSRHTLPPRTPQIGIDGACVEEREVSRSEAGDVI